MSNSAIIYRGPSMLDGSPIVVVATGLGKSSLNTKTGALVQTWIIRDDMSPVEAVKSGADSAICGACPHRGEAKDGKVTGRSCYVAVFQAPLSVYKTLKAGKYETVEANDLGALFQGKRVRLGAYGDPAAVPMWVWDAVLSGAEAFTGYTHQWRTCPQELNAYVMASCDTAQDWVEAKRMGWRTFRVRTAAEPLQAREVICPASKEAGLKTNCAACVACGGHGAKAKVDIAIVAHGSASVTKAFNARVAA
jgi:hypothetical protein